MQPLPVPVAMATALLVLLVLLWFLVSLLDSMALDLLWFLCLLGLLVLLVSRVLLALGQRRDGRIHFHGGNLLGSQSSTATVPRLRLIQPQLRQRSATAAPFRMPMQLSMPLPMPNKCNGAWVMPSMDNKSFDLHGLWAQ